jgi:predicted permease
VTVMLFSTVGAAIAVKSSGTKELLLSDILRRVTRFPPLIGCVLALTVPKFIDITPVAPLFDAIAATTAPLAIFSIGLQLQLKGWCEQRGIVCTILAYKLFLAPTAVLVTLLALRIKGTSAEVSVFQMSMPALLSSAVLANQFNLNPGLVNRIVGIGIAVGLCSTGIWYLSTKLLG